MSDYDDEPAVMDDDGREDSFNQPMDDDNDFDDAEPDSFDETKEDDGVGSSSTFTSSNSTQSLSASFEPAAERKEFEALDEAALRAHMNRLVADVASVIDVKKDKAALLLRTQKWNKERLIAEYFEDPQRMLRKAGMEHYDEADDEVEAKSSGGGDGVEVTCPICDDEVPISDTYSLGDGHRFCTSCWRDYLSSALLNGRSVLFTTCPAYQCAELCHGNTFQLLCSPSDYARYSSYLLRSYVEDNVSMRWCTSPGCPYAMHAFHRGLQSVSCPSGHSFCFQCQEEAHEPCSCAQLVVWKEKNALESDNAHWIIANTKRCPQCTVRIEKNQGCNHITCRACKFDWVDHGNHTGGFYKCNKYDPKQAGKQSKWKVEPQHGDAAAAERKDGGGKEKEKDGKSAEALKLEKDAELNRYLFYYQRYHNHAESAKFASQLRRDTDKKMQSIAAAQQQHTHHSTANHSSRPSSTSPAHHGEALLIDFAFLQHATDVILRCRHVLKYTYVFAYFLVGDEREGERNLMEFLQQQLEKAVEALSELTEQKVEVLARKDEKSRIVNYTRVTDKFRDNLLQGVRNGLTG